MLPRLPLARLLLGLSVATSTAGAQPANPASVPAPASVAPLDRKAEAARLYKDGVALFKSKQFAAAAERFEEAYKLDPSPILLYNRARAAEEMGDANGAVDRYRKYLAEYPQAEDRAEVERRIRVLEAVARTAQPGVFVVKDLPADAAVIINDAPAPARDLNGAWTLPPGRYVVRVAQAGGTDWRKEVDVRSAETLTIAYDGLQTAAPPPAGGEAEDGRPMRLAGWISLAVGSALAGTGVFFALQSQSAADEYGEARTSLAELLSEGRSDTDPAVLAAVKKKNNARADAQDDATMANIFLAIGAAGVVTGATLVVLDAMDERGDGASASFVLTPGGLGLVGTF